MPETLDGILSFASFLAKDAGKVIRQYFDTSDKSVEIKSDSSPVTIADKTINQLVIDRVASSYPTHGVLAEEGSSHVDRHKLWVCDPIDGTKGYILGIPTALFSLAYVVNGQPEVAVIYDAFQEKLYSAIKGKGAKLNSRPIKVSSVNQLAGANICGPTSYQQLKTRRALFDNLLDLGAGQLIVPGNVFKSTLVAQGSVAGYIFPGRSAHDIAAAKLIIEEAGGKVTDLCGEQQQYDQEIYGAIISNGYLHDELVRLVEDFGTDKYVGY